MAIGKEWWKLRVYGVEGDKGESAHGAGAAAPSPGGCVAVGSSHGTAVVSPSPLAWSSREGAQREAPAGAGAQSSFFFPDSLPSPIAAARVWISPSPEVHEGDAVTLTCAVDSAAQEALTYTWYKNGVRLSSGTAPHLVLPSVGAADAASYHCAVQSPAGTRSVAPSTLSVLCEFGGASEPPSPSPGWNPPGTACGCRQCQRGPRSSQLHKFFFTF